jgi:hypothetical protein
LGPRNNYWTSTVGGCGYTRTVDGKYANRTFCGTIDTWVEHTVTFTAKGGGASSASWYLADWSGCSGLLVSRYTYDPK